MVKRTVTLSMPVVTIVTSEAERRGVSFSEALRRLIDEVIDSRAKK
jgi:hypothetical protein